MEDKRTTSREEAAAHIKRCFEIGVEYQQEMGFTKSFPQYVNFYEGRQWPKVAKGTENMPRPVVNFTKMICRNKKSAILSVPGRIVYHAENQSPAVQKFNHFAAYIQREMKQETLDREAIHNATLKGSYAYHYFWDAEASGLDATTKGALRCEVLDTLKVFFSNPASRDEQKQKWILIATREEVDRVRQYADEGVNTDEICADENAENHYEEKEQGKDQMCTVLTRYFRKGGKVYWERATKSVLINEARPLCPDVEAVLKRTVGDAGPYTEDAQEALAQEKAAVAVDGMELYPIVMGSYEPREGSIYGLGEVEGLLPNQKAVNLHLAMSLFNAQQLAWGKYIVVPGALGNQTITNEPGQVLIDYSKTGNGIRRMTEHGLNGQPMDLVNTVMSLTRSVTGSTEVMTGETVGSGMSGAAIAALQTQAQQPVEELREAFWQVKVKQGHVLAQFFKQYYNNYPFTYTEKDVQTGEEQSMPDTFSGADYAGMNFDVVVEAMTGTKATTAGDITALDNLLAQKAISPETYIAIYPEDAISNKSELLEAVENEKKSEIAQLQMQLEQMQAALEQAQNEAAAKQKAFDAVQSTVKENQSLKEQLGTLYRAFNELRAVASERIEQANAVIAKLEKDGMEVARDAQEFAMALAGRQGVPSNGPSRTPVPTGVGAGDVYFIGSPFL